MFLKLSQNLQEKICVEVSFFNKVVGYRPVTLLKKRLWHRCFHVSSLKFLRTPSFVKHGGGFYNQSFQATYIFPKLCTHVHKPFSTHLSQKKNKERYNSWSTSRIEHKLRCAYQFFSHSRAFWWTARKESKYKKKLQEIVNLPCLGNNTGKRKIVIHIYLCLQRSSWTKRQEFNL